MKSYYLSIDCWLNSLFAFRRRRCLLTKCSENIWHRCLKLVYRFIESSYIDKAAQILRVRRMVEKFSTRLTLLLSVHEVILKSSWFPQRSSAYNSLVRTTKIRDCGEAYVLYTSPFVIFLQYRQWTQELDAGQVPEGLQAMLEEFGSLKREQSSSN